MFKKKIEMHTFILGMVFLAILSVVLKWRKDKQIIESFTSNIIVDSENIFQGSDLSGFDASGNPIDYAKNFGMYGAVSGIIDSGSDISGHNDSVDAILTKINSSIAESINQIKGAVEQYKSRRITLISRIQNAIDNSHEISLDDIIKEKSLLEELRGKIFNSLKTVNITRSALNKLGGDLAHYGDTTVYGNKNSIKYLYDKLKSVISPAGATPGSPLFSTILNQNKGVPTPTPTPRPMPIA